MIRLNLRLVLLGLVAFVQTALAAPAQTSSQNAVPLTNQAVLKMLDSGLSPEFVADLISRSECRFDTSPETIERLKKAGVKEVVLRAMVQKQGPTASVESSRPTNVTDQQTVLTNDSVLKLVKAGMGEEVIVSMVNSQSGQYSLSTDSLIALKQAGASDRIIAAMVNRNAGSNRPVMVAPQISTATLTLHDATPIRMRLTRNLSSADAKTGDTIDFEVLEDLKVDDVLVIARGATAIATVTEAQAKRRMARGGKLDITID